MTYFQIFSSIIGIGFLYGGIKVFTESKGWSAMCLIIAFFLINQVLFGEISKSDDKQQEIQELKPEEISKIIFLPSQRRNILSEDTLVLYSVEKIKAIQECLSKTKETLRSNRNGDWGVILNIQKINKENIYAGVSKQGDQTILELYSRGEYGTNYGTMINNEFGDLIEKIFEKKKASR